MPTPNIPFLESTNHNITSTFPGYPYAPTRRDDTTYIQLYGPPDNQKDLFNENPTYFQGNIPSVNKGSGIDSRGPAIQFRPQSDIQPPTAPTIAPYDGSQFYNKPFVDTLNYNYYFKVDINDPSGNNARRNIFMRSDNKQPFRADGALASAYIIRYKNKL